MRKLVICALALGGFAASAQAADLSVDSMKDPLPDTLSWHGITVYGTIDVGYAYQTNGVPTSGALYTGLEYNPVTTSKNYTGRAISALSDNGLSQSNIGVKFEEAIGMGWAAIGKLETGFVPLSGEIADACASMVRNNGVAAAAQNANADGSRCGQAFNQAAYVGVSNATYGTLTVGRQNSLDLDTIATYDPMGLSYAFSLIGYSGTNAGAGDTEAARWDNSIKYVYQYGPVHAGAEYSQGGQDTAIHNGAYGFNVGGTWRGFSLDAVYTKENGVVGAAPLSAAQCGVTGVNCSNNILAATISDNEEVTVAGKYVYEFGNGWKDEGPGAKLTLFAGYTHLDLGNPSDPVSGTTIGGYQLAASAVNNAAFFTDRILQYEWAGAKYELPSGWSFTASYYHESQNTFVAGSLPTGGGTTTASKCTAGGSTKSNCAGDVNQVSGLVDYAFNKHFDVYAGVSYVNVDGGFAAGFPGVSTTSSNSNINTTVVMTGLRLKF